MPAHASAPWAFTDGSETVNKVAAKLLLRGAARLDGWRAIADALPYCDTPVRVALTRQRGCKPLEVSFWAPCRRCVKCLQFRSLRWRERALRECAATLALGRRTWFVTLTFSPAHLAGVLAEARKEFGDAELVSVDRAAYRHVRGYLDRVRKAGFPFRYLAVMERGEQTGRLHYHLLLHESRAGPVLKRTLETRWRSHVHCRLVDMDKDRGVDGAASYVAKYATKSCLIRMRASARYGSKDK